VSELPPGLVVVGELIGSGEAQQRDIVGKTPKPRRAAYRGSPSRTRSSFATSTRRLLGNLFELKDLEFQGTSKGIAGADAGLGGAAGEFRGKAASRRCTRPALDRPLSGREGRIRNCFFGAGLRAKSGEGQGGVALWRGPASGKNRGSRPPLLEKALPRSRMRGLRFFCSPQRTDSALYPIISQMEKARAGTGARRHPASQARPSSMRCWRGPRPQL